MLSITEWELCTETPILIRRIILRRITSAQNAGYFFAGQITGVEGYIESTASGLLAGYYAGLEALGKNVSLNRTRRP